jgi:hypothetical protein
VESSCERGNEPSGSIKCWELLSGCTSCGLSGGTQLHRVSCQLMSAGGGDATMCFSFHPFLKLCQETKISILQDRKRGQFVVPALSFRGSGLKGQQWPWNNRKQLANKIY